MLSNARLENDPLFPSGVLQRGAGKAVRDHHPASAQTKPGEDMGGTRKIGKIGTVPEFHGKIGTVPEFHIALANWARCLGASAGAGYLCAIVQHSRDAGPRPTPPWERSSQLIPNF